MAEPGASGAPPQLQLPDFLSGLPPEGCFTPSAASEDLLAPTPHAPAVLPSVPAPELSSSSHTPTSDAAHGQVPPQQQQQQQQQQQHHHPHHSPQGPHSPHHQRSSSHSGDDEFEWAFETAAADLAPVLHRPKRPMDFELVVAAPSSSLVSTSSSSSTYSGSTYSTPILHLKRALSSVPESDQEGEEPADPTANITTRGRATGSRRGTKELASLPPGAAAAARPVQQCIDTWQVRGNACEEQQQQQEAMACQDSGSKQQWPAFDMASVVAAAEAARQRRTSHGGSTGGAAASSGGGEQEGSHTMQQQQQQRRGVQPPLAEEGATAVAVVQVSSSGGGEAAAAAGSQDSKQHTAHAAAAGEDEWEAASKQRLKELAGDKAAAGQLAQCTAGAGGCYAATLSALRSPGPLAAAVEAQRAAVLASLPAQRWSLATLMGGCCGGRHRAGAGAGAGAGGGGSLEEERVWVGCLARLPLDTSTHPALAALLTGIYQSWTGREVAVPRYGVHWGEIGFQGDDPATDLRTAGLLGALQLAALPEQHPGLARALLELSHSDREFPLAVVSLNITTWGLAAARQGRLAAAAGRRGGLLAALEAFHGAAFQEFYTRWSAGGSMAQAGFILKQLEQDCRAGAGRLALTGPS